MEDKVRDIKDLEDSKANEGLESKFDGIKEEEKEEATTHERLNPHEEDLDEHPHHLRTSQRGNVHLGNHQKELHAVSRPNHMDTVLGKEGPMYVVQVKRYVNSSFTRGTPISLKTDLERLFPSNPYEEDGRS
ncbi:hypothetical protein FRC03_010992 [Tulasnella sp. 419]|nr:hypothetical protein FRC03_010992 [Tulasnella sp. 419]